jgi:hypothetical protein
MTGSKHMHDSLYSLCPSRLLCGLYLTKCRVSLALVQALADCLRRGYLSKRLRKVVRHRDCSRPCVCTLPSAIRLHSFDRCQPCRPQDGRLPQPLIIREVARKVLKEKGFSREDITASPTRALQLQKHILDAQHNAESEASLSNTSEWYICDRSGLDPIVYAKYFVGWEAAAEMLASRSWIELEARMKAGIVVMCEAGCHWLKDDGIRLMPNDAAEWTGIDDAFRSLLEEREIRYCALSKDMTDLGERVDFVKRLIVASCS